MENHLLLEIVLNLIFRNWFSSQPDSDFILSKSVNNNLGKKMQIPSLYEIKKELSYLNEKEINELLLDLVKFNRENKAYLYFKLYSRDNPGLFVEMVQQELEEEFTKANQSSSYHVKKSSQTIRRKFNKFLKLTKSKTDQVDLILFFCEKLTEYGYLRFRNPVVDNLYQVQLGKAKKLISGLHEDLKWDYEMKMEEFK